MSSVVGQDHTQVLGASKRLTPGIGDDYYSVTHVLRGAAWPLVGVPEAHVCYLSYRRREGHLHLILYLLQCGPRPFDKAYLHTQGGATIHLPPQRTPIAAAIFDAHRLNRYNALRVPWRRAIDLLSLLFQAGSRYGYATRCGIAWFGTYRRREYLAPVAQRIEQLPSNYWVANDHLPRARKMQYPINR